MLLIANRVSERCWSKAGQCVWWRGGIDASIAALGGIAKSLGRLHPHPFPKVPWVAAKRPEKAFLLDPCHPPLACESAAAPLPTAQFCEEGAFSDATLFFLASQRPA